MTAAEKRPIHRASPAALPLKPRRTAFLILSLVLLLWVLFLITLIARDRGYLGS